MGNAAVKQITQQDVVEQIAALRTVQNSSLLAGKNLGSVSAFAREAQSIRDALENAQNMLYNLGILYKIL